MEELKSKSYDVQLILNQCFEDWCTSDSILENTVEYYLSSEDEIEERSWKNQMLVWFIENKPKMFDVEKFMVVYDDFIEKIDSLKL